MADWHAAAGGNDTTGDGSIGNPYLTGQKCIDVSANGDTIYLKNDKTYTETLTIPANTNRRIIGYSSTIDDRGVATIDGGASRANGVKYSNTSGASHVGFGILANLRITNHTSHGFWYDVSSGDANNKGLVSNCRFDNNGGDGVLFEANGHWVFEFCSFDNNSGYGFDQDSETQASCHACVAYDNTAHGISRATYVIDCAAWGNGLDGFNNCEMHVNCVAYDNASDGFYSVNAGAMFHRCIAESNGAYGFFATNASAARGYYCWANANTSGNFSAGTSLSSKSIPDGGASYDSDDFNFSESSGMTNPASQNFVVQNSGNAWFPDRQGIGLLASLINSGRSSIGLASEDPPAGGGASAWFG